MAYKADCDYTVTISDAQCVESQKGNSGFELRLSSDHGTIRHTIWVTEASLSMAKKQMKACGLTEADMGSDRLWNDPGSLFNGKTVDIRTKEEVDQRDGRAWVKVAFILTPGGWAKPAADETRARGRSLLASAVADKHMVEPNAHGAYIDDDSIPF